MPAILVQKRTKYACNNSFVRDYICLQWQKIFKHLQSDRVGLKSHLKKFVYEDEVKRSSKTISRRICKWEIHISFKNSYFPDIGGKRNILYHKDELYWFVLKSMLRRISLVQYMLLENYMLTSRPII